RDRSQLASGGGIFSISDSPIAFEKLDWNKTAVYPESTKLSGDPTPFEVTFHTEPWLNEDGSWRFGPKEAPWVLPMAETKKETVIQDAAARKRILMFLKTSPGEWFSTEEVNAGAKLKTDGAAPVLKKLLAEKLVRFCTKDDAKALGRSTLAKL